jgi:hypothetical protein
MNMVVIESLAMRIGGRKFVTQFPARAKVAFDSSEPTL